METFTWLMHTFSVAYPDTGFKVQFGNSYEYAEGSPSPDQRVITLSFPLMKYFVNEDGSLNPSRMVGSPTPALETALSPAINMKTLEDFYNVHKLWKAFIYPHAVYGNLTVRFKTPLKIPAGIPDGDGAVGAFSLELIELP